MRLQIHLKHLLRIFPVLPQPGQHIIRAEIRQRRVVDLHVPQPFVVQRPDLLPVRLRQIREEGPVVRVHGGIVALALGQTQVEVTRRRHGELTRGPLLAGDALAEQFPVVEVRRLAVLDLPLADGRHGVLFARFLERGDGRRAQPRQLPRHRAHLLEPAQLLEEAGEVVFPVELAGADGVDVVGSLRGDDGLDGLLLGGAQLGRVDGAGVEGVLRSGDGLGPDERADVVGVEGEFGDRHDCYVLGVGEVEGDGSG